MFHLSGVFEVGQNAQSSHFTLSQNEFRCWDCSYNNDFIFKTHKKTKLTNISMFFGHSNCQLIHLTWAGAGAHAWESNNINKEYFFAVCVRIVEMTLRIEKNFWERMEGQSFNLLFRLMVERSKWKQIAMTFVNRWNAAFEMASPLLIRHQNDSRKEEKKWKKNTTFYSISIRHELFIWSQTSNPIHFLLQLSQSFFFGKWYFVRVTQR